MEETAALSPHLLRPGLELRTIVPTRRQAWRTALLDPMDRRLLGV
jgi:hypothetical protein